MKKRSVFLYLLFASCGVLKSLPVQAVSEQNMHVFTSLVKGHLMSSSDTAIDTKEISAERTRWVVETRLSPGVLNKKTVESGISLQFTPVHTLYSSNITLLELVYPDATTAARVQKKLANGRYLTNSKILTPYSCVEDGNQVLIIFTESAGDSKIATFIEDFPMLWRNKMETRASSQS